MSVVGNPYTRVYRAIAMTQAQFKKGDLCKLLNALADEIQKAGHAVDLYLYGGAGLILTGEANREVTGDIDAYSPQQALNAFFRDARKTIAENSPLDAGAPVERRWLEVNNVDLKEMLKDKDNYFTDTPPELEALKAKGLSIRILKPEAQLAMKLARNNPAGPSERDKADVRALAASLGIKSEDGLIDIWKRHATAMGESADKTAKVIRNIRSKTYWEFGKAP